MLTREASIYAAVEFIMLYIKNGRNFFERIQSIMPEKIFAFSSGSGIGISFKKNKEPICIIHKNSETAPKIIYTMYLVLPLKFLVASAHIKNAIIRTPFVIAFFLPQYLPTPPPNEMVFIKSVL